MSLRNLNKEELAAVAEFFVVDVDPADPEKGASKKELLAALAEGDEPVTWEQYKEFYLPAQVAPEAAIVSSEEIGEPVAPTAVTPENVDEEDEGDKVLVKFEGKNPTLEIVGYVFTNRHPFQSVPAKVAEHLVRNQPGFRLAMPSEVTDYYN